MLFTDLSLDSRLLQALALQDLIALTPIQEQAIPHSLLGKDLLASSKTGSGKTLAFVVPAVQRVLTQPALAKRDARVLILAPTRELAKQVFSELNRVIKGAALKAALVVGGDNYNDQVKALRRNPPFVVGTPGRVADHLQSRSLFLNGLEMLILDEADRMLDLGFQDQLQQINRAADHRKRQTLLFSATLHAVVVNDLARDLQSDPHHISIDAVDQANPAIHQSFYFADNVAHKQRQLQHLLTTSDIDQAIVFTATRADTQRLAQLAADWDLSSAALSGDLLQQQRSHVMQEFSRNSQQVLFTTDVASRGLDIPRVSLVINFDLPKTADEYIHRIGRTGRSGATGMAISLVGPRDWSSLQLLKTQLHQDFNFCEIAGDPAAFAGVRPQPRSKRKRSAKSAANPERSQPRVARQRRSQVDTMAGRDVGDLPFIPAQRGRKPSS